MACRSDSYIVFPLYIFLGTTNNLETIPFRNYLRELKQHVYQEYRAYITNQAL